MAKIDQSLRPYATDVTWACYEAYCKAGSMRKAAALLGRDESNVRRGIRRIFENAAENGHPSTFTVKGTSTLTNKDGDEVGKWTKTRRASMPSELAIRVPDPKAVVETSTHMDGQGGVLSQWVKEKAELVEREKLWAAFADGLKDKLPRVAPVSIAKTIFNKDLLAIYPVGDHHIGMHAWDEETGSDNYDIKASEKLLLDSASYLIGSAPAAENALICFLGDFMHYDSFDSVTPTSKNLLDADSRFPKMVRAAIRSMRGMIQLALTKHKKVHVIVEIGNHDLASSVFLMEALAAIYENEPRVHVDTSPSHYHYFEHGRCLIGTHHGHGGKPDKLPGIMAHDRPEAWGRTIHRIWFTGHIHTRSAWDFPGCTVESMRILAPVDAWAANKGYRPIRDMKGIVFHAEHGEVDRKTVNPLMFKPRGKA
jgi:hypothetical protein